MRRLALVACFFSVIPLYGQSGNLNDVTSASTSSGPTDATFKHPSALTDSEAHKLLKTPVPHPFVSIGPLLMGAGYAPQAWGLKTGIDVESTRVFFLAHAAYDTGRQVNDGVQPNPKGHDRYLAAAASLRLPWRLPSVEPFLGCGWRWNQLSTTRYTKGADRPQIGAGFDYWRRACPTCRPNFSTRFGMNWVLVGSDWQNGVHGPEISISIPSLREARHCFFVATIAVYGFHQTVTDRANIQLMRSQRADRGVFPVVNLGLLYRF